MIEASELTKKKPDVVRTTGYEVDMQTGGVTIMPSIVTGKLFLCLIL